MMPQDRPTILIAESGSGFGGSAKYLSGLLEHVDHRRFLTRVVSYGDGPFIQQIRRRGWPVELRPSWRHPWWTEWFQQEQEGWGRMARYGAHALVTGAQLGIQVLGMARLLRRQRVALVHLNNEILSHLPLLVAAAMTRTPVICHLHGWRPLTRLERWASRYVHAFIGITHRGSAFYQRQVPHRPVVPIPNGIAVNGWRPRTASELVELRRRFGLRPDGVCFGILGRLMPWKGHQQFLRALALVVRQAPNVQAIVMGNDPKADQSYQRALERLAQELEISEQVHLLQWRESVDEALAVLDILVSASNEPESFGLVIGEAMLAGKPVIGTDGGGVPDLVRHEQTGLLVPMGSVEHLAEAMVRLARDRALAARLAAAAQAHIRAHFTLPGNAERVMALYEETLRCAPPAAWLAHQAPRASFGGSTPARGEGSGS